MLSSNHKFEPDQKLHTVFLNFVPEGIKIEVPMRRRRIPIPGVFG